MTFYLKYRPQNFEALDLVDVRQQLLKIMGSKSIPHAFLFSGPKGTGKTSAARILAKSINCESDSKKLRGNELIEPCNQCGQCLSITKGSNIDVMELDAASNRGIDDIRNLREAVKLAPNGARKKIYIIDEVHMLTLEASNALLKTLEEPPSHVVFILATTNPEKLIPTIRSRTINILFKKASNDELIKSFERVAKMEKLNVEKGVLEMIANNSDGAFRDGVKILENLASSGKKITKDYAEKIIEGISSFESEKILSYVNTSDIDDLLKLIKKHIDNGISAKNITHALISRLRESMLAQAGLSGRIIDGFSSEETIFLIEALIKSLHDITVSPKEEIPLEITLVTFSASRTKAEDGNNVDNNKGDIDKGQKEGKKPKSVTVANIKQEDTKNILKDTDNTVVINKLKENNKSHYQETVSKDLGEISEELWTQILLTVRSKNTSTEALLRAAKPLSFDGKSLTLGVYYSFHKDKLEINPHRLLLEDTISAMIGNNIRVRCVLSKPPEKPKEDIQKPSEDVKSDANEVILSEEKSDDIIKLAEEIFS